MQQSRFSTTTLLTCWTLKMNDCLICNLGLKAQNKTWYLGGSNGQILHLQFDRLENTELNKTLR